MALLADCLNVCRLLPNCVCWLPQLLRSVSSLHPITAAVRAIHIQHFAPATTQPPRIAPPPTTVQLISHQRASPLPTPCARCHWLSTQEPPHRPILAPRPQSDRHCDIRKLGCAPLSLPGGVALPACLRRPPSCTAYVTCPHGSGWETQRIMWWLCAGQPQCTEASAACLPD